MAAAARYAPWPSSAWSIAGDVASIAPGTCVSTATRTIGTISFRRPRPLAVNDVSTCYPRCRWSGALERRNGKDFEAAFGENPEDARLLRAPGCAESEKVLQSARTVDSELFETGESLQLLCPQGHLIKKKKKLKPWQDIMAGDKVCNECQETINRDAFRWRCEYHCDCNICDDCYGQHWFEIMAMVHKTRDEQKSWQLLSAIPLHLRDSQEFQAARARVDRRATRDQSEALGSPTPILEQKAALAAYGTEAGPTNLKGRVQGLLRWIDRVVENRPMAQIIFWVVLACAAEAEVWQRAMDLQGSSTHEGDFPHPLLLACFSCFVASGFLQLLLLALRIFRRRFGELPPAPAPPPALWPAIQYVRELHAAANAGPDLRRQRRARRRARRMNQTPPPLQPQKLQVYLLLGILLCFENSIMVLLWYQGVQRLTLGLHPFALLLAGLMAGTESAKDHRMLLSMALASLAGFLTSFEAFTELQGLLALASQLLAALRWKLSDNVLPAFDAVPSDRCAAAVVLAANQAVACAMATLELSMFDLPGYWHLLDIREPVHIVQGIGIIGLFFAVKLVAYLNLARVSSFPLMGLLPMISASLGLRVSQLSVTRLISILFATAAWLCFLRARQRRPEIVQEDYEALEDGPQEL